MKLANYILALAAFCVSTASFAEEVTIDFMGRTLNGVLMMAEGREIDAPLVLLTHGTLAHNRMEIIETFQSQLTEAGFNTLAINLSLGLDKRHGMYDCATPHRHTHREAVDELGAWLAWLKGKGASRIILLGHSRGGNQTAWFASEHDDPVIEKVVLVAPMTWTKGADVRDYKQRYGKELAPILSRARQMVDKGKGNEMLKGVDFLYCTGTTASANAIVDYYANEPRFDTPALLHKIAKPVLVIAGSEDTTVPDVEKKVKPLADGERVSLVVIDGAEHFFRDLYSEEATESIAQFIRK